MVARYRCLMDFYRPILEKLVFPAMEAAHGRPTLSLLHFLHGSEHWSLDALRDLQHGLLRRLIRHAASHPAHNRGLLAERSIAPDDIATTHDLRHLPVLERAVARAVTRAVTRDSHDTAESHSWRDATRWRGYGWAGYRVGMRALHYL